MGFVEGEVTQNFTHCTLWRNSCHWRVINIPINITNDHASEVKLGQNALLWGLTRWGWIFTGMGVTFGVVATWILREGEIKPCKEWCTVSLMGDFVVSVAHERVKGPLQPMTPFFQSQLDCQMLPVANVKFSFSKGQVLVNVVLVQAPPLVRRYILQKTLCKHIIFFPFM